MPIIDCAKSHKPYAVHQSGEWFNVMDTRNCLSVSYPTQSASRARRERDTLNRAYAEAVKETEQ